MAKETNAPESTARPKRRGLKIIGITLGVLLVLLVVVYLVATSAGFLKGVILPRVSDGMQADVTVGDASISAFSQVVLRDLKVQPRGEKEPLFSAAEVRARYSLMQIIRGNILVEEVAVSKPVILLVQKPDGGSNLDPILKGQAKQPAKPEAPAGAPMQIDIRQVQITGGTIRQVKLYDASHQDVTEISNFGMKLTNLKNGQTGKLEVGGDVRLQNNPPAPDTEGTLQATLNGTIDLGLSKDLKPALVQGNSRLTVTQSTGKFAGVGKSAGELDVDITAAEIRNVTLRLVRDNQALAQIRAQGPFNLEKLEGAISVTLDEMDRRSLNVLGAAAGLDFGTSVLSSTNLVQVFAGAEKVAVRGRFAASRFQVVRTNETTPPLDLGANYDVEVSQAQQSALLRVFELSGRQNNEVFLTGHLTSPMNFGWATNAQAVGDSDLNIVLTNFNLVNWKALLGEVAPAGVANATLQLRSTQGGAVLNYILNSRLENLALLLQSNRVDQIALGLNVRGQAVGATNHSLAELQLAMTHQGRQACEMNGSGTFNSESKQGAFQFTGQAAMPVLMKLAPQPDTTFSSGETRFTLRLAQTQDVSVVTGSVVLTNLTGQMASNRFNAYWLASDLDVKTAGDKLEIRRAQGALGEGPDAGGRFDVAGQLAMSNLVGRITGRIEGMNQHGLRPFVEGALGGMKLETVLVTANFDANLNSVSNMAFTAQMAMTNLVVRDPAGKIPATPLGMGAQLQATIINNVAELKNTQLQLTPTDKARNLVTLAARIDYSNTNAMRGNVDLKADALDLTRYYDLFEAKGTGTQASTTPAPPSAGAPETEPEPIKVPVTNFVARAAVGQFYLRELQLTNVEAAVRVDGGRIQISPARMAVNGAPVEMSAAVDVSVPGYKYETRFSAGHVPFAPLVNTFMPERKGQLGGTLTATGYVAGAGITGPNLKKHLAGNFDIGTTNLNLSLTDVKSPLLRTIVNVIAIIPDLRKNPNAALGSLAGSLLGGSSSSRASGYMEELTKSPIDIIETRGTIGSGRVGLDRALLQSRAFQVNAQGAVNLADVLTNSTLNIPLHVALEHSLAQKIEMVPAGTPTNQAYVALPDYVTIKGTVGEPKSDINKMALLGTALEQLGGKIPGVDQKTGSLLQGLGGMLTGRRATTPDTNAAVVATTNAPAVATNVPAAMTNAPAAAPTNQSPVGDLLNNLLGPKRK